MDSTERDSFVRWCEDRKLATDVIARLLEVIPDDESSDSDFTNWIDCPGYIKSVNDPDQGLGFDVELRDAGLLIIGSCPNGDPVLLAFREDGLPVYYLSHEQMFTSPLIEVIRRVSNSLEEYHAALSDEDSGVPLDYWD